MAVVIASVSRDSELAALRLQEEELQAQQDALFAEQLAFSFALEEDAADFQQTSDAAIQVQKQRDELRTKMDELLALSLQEILSEQEKLACDGQRVADAEDQLQRWNARIAQHDRAFARKLASTDEDTWEEIGDALEEPLDLPPPPHLPTCQDDDAAVHCSGSAAAVPQPSRSGFTCTSQPTAYQESQSQYSRSRGPSFPSQPCASIPQAPQATAPGSKASSVNASAPSSLPIPSTSASSGKQAVAAPKAATATCQSCYDDVPLQDLMCAGSDGASSSTAAAGCGHYFCTPCMTEYVRGAVKERKYPVPCPMAAAGGGGGAAARGGGGAGGRGGGGGGTGCSAKLSREEVLGLLEAFPAEQQTFRQLEALSALDPDLLIYCPHKDCSSPLLRPTGHDDEWDAEWLPPDEPMQCPACKRALCPRCLIPGWHKGYTCAQFQQLPPHQRSAEDAAALLFSAKQQWKQCPSCKQMVERSEGCNHMRCRCGCDFCYACGKAYRDSSPTADNQHGTPACGCSLFDVPEERPRPVRGGRKVSRTRCRNSASIHDCPNGVDRCWFWHAEDDEVA
ncbi:hypothetical protein Agub_g2811 [Astrephomene gubernaculifera]|uniref:RBR-type E3 ubiquitin transferase n=1 Tax=Astrephomene gubernaculifera TaxID=47775 RepID=A0AAD3DKA6_9CHLO|nr:hypothetical protein Agub_g2811 [Astrephomene gubernaculifera]